MRCHYAIVRLATALGLTLFAVAAAPGQRPVQPANESRRPITVRSPNSTGADLAVPLCASRFHDSLAKNGIANAHEFGVVQPRLIKKVPAQITREAVNAGASAHITNYLVIMDVVVDAEGHPEQPCIANSSGYGLDAASAAALEQYRWKPARRNGKAVAMRIPVHFEFVNPLPPPMSPARSR